MNEEREGSVVVTNCTNFTNCPSVITLFAYYYKFVLTCCVPLHQMRSDQVVRKVEGLDLTVGVL